MQRCDRLYARRRRRRGAALLMAVVTLAVVTALAVSLVWTGNSELQASAGFRDISVARSAADSGLQYFLLLMEDCRSERLHVDETPDMFDVVYDHLTEALPDTPPSIEGEGTERRVVLPDIDMGDGSSFAMVLSGTEWSDDGEPTAMRLEVTGRYGQTERAVWAGFNVQVDDDVLNYAIATTLRVLVRGNNTILNGDIISSWERAVYESYPFDIGNTDWSYRNDEHIEINHMNSDGSIAQNEGELGTSLSRAQFYGEEDLPNDWGRKDCSQGVRDPDLLEQLVFGRGGSDRFDMTYEDFDTSKYRDREEVSGGLSALDDPDAIEDDQKVTLPYPLDNEPTGYATYSSDSWKYTEDGSWCYGYPHEGNWVIYSKNPDGKWEFGYYASNDPSSWTKVNRNPETDAPIGRYEYKSGYIGMGDAYVTDPCPNPEADAKIVFEQWSSSLRLWRAYYANYNGTDNPKFKNLHIPKGSHAHFKNCTFTGITYVETDETTDLSDDSGYGSGYDRYNKLRRDATIGSGSGSQNTEACNNVVFENCTFEGPIVSGVPKDLRFMDNAVQFIGETVFDASAIREELQGTTIMMPNYNVNIGDFDETTTGCESEIVGILLGGIVDIRDNAVIHGTLMNMAPLAHVSDWGVSAGFASNIGNYEGSTSETYVPYDTYEDIEGDINEPRDERVDFEPGPSPAFSPSENIVITPDPDNVIPYGMRVRYELVFDEGTFGEGP